MQISESVWIVSRSVALVQYADIANSSAWQQAINHTLRYVKFIFILALAGITLIACIPSVVYKFLLGKDFTGIQTVVLILVPGIVALACSHPLSAFFSGIGKIRINMYGSLLGLVTTCVFSIILIPTWGIWGAAVTQTLSYLTTFSFAMINFLRISQLKPQAFTLTRNEIIMWKRWLASWMRKIKFPIQQS
jgi:O-antigen/teichoic acid export membrane protein